MKHTSRVGPAASLMSVMAVMAVMATLLFSLPLPAQSPCPDFGGQAVPSRWDDAPFALVCGQVSAPAWRLFTPAHRAPGPRPGYTPRDAHALPRLLFTYRCSGLWWLPIAPERVRVMGYVVDQPDRVCTIAPGPTAAPPQ